MGKQAEQAAAEKRKAKAADLYAKFRARTINTGQLIQSLVSEGFYSKGELKTKHRIGSEHFQRAASKKSTGITTEQREKLLREFTTAHAIAYTPPAIDTHKYRPLKGSAPQQNAA